MNKSISITNSFCIYKDYWLSGIFFLLVERFFYLIFIFVALISGSVLYFRGRYIPINRKFRGFIILVFIFVLNLVRIILGWDGLGIISYILVVFYNNEKSNRAGILTVIRNRIGDSALLLSVAYFMEIRR
ncbi:NADH-ubiquinone oxidoreductase chain 5 [Armadillidium vulgare]|nr:NADH-ubiquinone oxidoreductase chain 5 [Armadillidium vulgare]